MAHTNINIRMDEELKKNFERFCIDTGMTMTTAFCIFAKKVVAEQKIPFEITANDPFYNKKNIERIKKAVEDLDNGKGAKHELIEVEDE